MKSIFEIFLLVCIAEKSDAFIIISTHKAVLKILRSPKTHRKKQVEEISIAVIYIQTEHEINQRTYFFLLFSLALIYFPIIVILNFTLTISLFHRNEVEIDY